MCGVVGGMHSKWGVCVTGGVHGRGACMAGGMHGRGYAWQAGACMAGGHAWQGGMHGRGAYMAGLACMAGRGMHGRGHVWQGACMVGVCMAGDMHGRGHAWQGVCVEGGHVQQGSMHGRRACMAHTPLPPTDTTRYGDMVNERVVRILLECILVVIVIVLSRVVFLKNDAVLA